MAEFVATDGMIETPKWCVDKIITSGDLPTAITWRKGNKPVVLTGFLMSSVRARKTPCKSVSIRLLGKSLCVSRSIMLESFASMTKV